MTTGVLLLAGCTSGQEQMSEASSAPTAPVSESAPTPTDIPSPTPREDKAVFVEQLQASVAQYGVELTRVQIEAAVDYTCDQKRAGVEAASIQVLPPGSPELANELAPGRANSLIVNDSWDWYCPQY